MNKGYGIDFDQVESDKIINSVDISPDGKYLAYSIEDFNVIKVIDLSKGDSGIEIFQHGNGVMGLYFSPNSKFLASVSLDGTSKLFSVENSFNNPHTLDFKFGFGGRVSFSHDSKKIAAATIVGADKNIVKIWDTDSGSLLKILDHDYAVASITFSKYNNSVYTGSSDLYVRYWSLNNEVDSPLISLKHEDRVEFIEEFPVKKNKHFILTVTDSGTVRIWDTKSRKAILGPIHNRSEVAPWQRCASFIEEGSRFIYNHSREVVHVNHFPIDFYLNTSPISMLSLAEHFMHKQKGITPTNINDINNDLTQFTDWYNESSNPKSFFINGTDLTEMADAYLRQNTTNSIHSGALIKAISFEN